MAFSQNLWRPSTLGLNDGCFHQNYGGPSGAGAETLFFYWKVGETSSTGQNKCQGRSKGGRRKKPKSFFHKASKLEAQWLQEE